VQPSRVAAVLISWKMPPFVWWITGNRPSVSEAAGRLLLGHLY
jgi:hypothetical protein